MKALENYSEIKLTDVELAEAVLEGLKKKERLLEYEKREAIANENRKNYTGFQWTMKQTASFIMWRMSKMKKAFVVDSDNEVLMELLTAYFSSDVSFVTLAQKYGVKNPSMEKGILLGGSVGVGKTTIMQLFSKNQRQVFFLMSAAEIADTFLEVKHKGEDFLDYLAAPKQLPIDDPENLYQSQMGLCIDDLGTEMMKNNFGNRKNVIASLIERRYEVGSMGPMMHLTTNLTMEQVREAYGERVASRLREKMNIIHYKGGDRRK